MINLKRGIVVLTACAVALVASIGNAVDAQSKSAAASNEWPTYGHDPGGKRFSPLTQLTPGNVGQLEVAWVYHMRPAPTTPPPAPPPTPAPGRGRGRGSGFAVSETTPIVIDGVMYISSPYGKVVALDSSTARSCGCTRCRPACRRRAASNTGPETTRHLRRSSSARTTAG